MTAVHPFFERYPDPCRRSDISGHLVWTEGAEIAYCGSESVIATAADPDVLRPVQLITVDDLGTMAVTLELMPEAAEELARRLTDAASAVSALRGHAHPDDEADNRAELVNRLWYARSTESMDPAGADMRARIESLGYADLHAHDDMSPREYRELEAAVLRAHGDADT